MSNNPAIEKLADKLYEFEKSTQTLVDIEQGYIKDARLPDPSIEIFRKNRAAAMGFKENINALRSTDLSVDDAIMLDVLEYICEADYLAIEDPLVEDYYWLRFQVTPYSCYFPKLHKVLSEFKFSTKDDIDDYLKMLDKYADFIHRVAERFKGQARRGIRLPKEEITLVQPMLKRLCETSEIQPLHLSQDRLKKTPSNVPGCQTTAKHSIAGIVGEIQKIIDFIDEDYQALAPDAVGLAQYPFGKSYYRLIVRQRMTVDTSPEEIHAIGLEQVDKTKKRMKDIRARLGYKCDRKAFQEINEQDPGFLLKTADQVGERLTSYLDKIRPVMDDFFLKNPEADCEIKRLDPRFEGSITFGYYMEPTANSPLGTFYYNGTNEVKKSQIGAASLVFHELLPGHHHQVSRVYEDEKLHPIRKNFLLTGYLEGWAEYAADLAGEMGMYENSHDEYGRLINILALSCRLVVDTGMNLLGWSRKKAADYLKEHTNFTDHMVFIETLRYACDLPGQALGYRLCCLEIFRMREKAKTALGDHFNIKAFHEVVLEHGVLPLYVLEKKVDRYIESCKR